jgi:hypothetical protein
VAALIPVSALGVLCCRQVVLPKETGPIIYLYIFIKTTFSNIFPVVSKANVLLTKEEDRKTH